MLGGTGGLLLCSYAALAFKTIPAPVSRSSEALEEQGWSHPRFDPDDPGSLGALKARLTDTSAQQALRGGGIELPAGEFAGQTGEESVGVRAFGDVAPGARVAGVLIDLGFGGADRATLDRLGGKLGPGNSMLVVSPHKKGSGPREGGTARGQGMLAIAHAVAAASGNPGAPLIVLGRSGAGGAMKDVRDFLGGAGPQARAASNQVARVVVADGKDPGAAYGRALEGFGTDAWSRLSTRRSPDASPALLSSARGDDLRDSPRAVSLASLGQGTASRAQPGAAASVVSLVAAAARKYGVPPPLALSIAQNESHFQQGLRSPVGAIGVMQLMPATARKLGVDPYDLRQNVDGGVRYLASLLRTFKSPALAAAAYNAGPGAVRKYHGVPPFRETLRYVRNVLGSRSNWARLATALISPGTLPAALYETTRSLISEAM